MGKPKPPKGPDWEKLIDMSKEFQAQNRDIFDEYMAFQRDAFDRQSAIQDEILDIALPGMRDEAQLGDMLRDKYRDMGLPFEEDYVDRLTSWDTAERRDERAGQAQGQVGAAMAAAREAELRRLEGYGIDPSQTRSAALDSRLRTTEALAKAAAGNQQRRAVEQEGLQYGAQAIDVMRGWNTGAKQGLQAGLGAGQVGLGGQQSVDQAMGASYPMGSNILAQGFGAVQGAYGTAGNLHQNDLARWELQQQYSPARGIGQLIGTGIGAVGAAGGVPNFFGFGAEGGPVGDDAVPRPPNTGIPTDQGYMRVTPGEFIIPDDVARWEGEKNLQKLINKAREDKAKTDQQRAANQQMMGIPA